MKYVIGIDLGTSAVKAILIDREGRVRQQVAKEYPLIQEKSGYSEQDPEEWVQQTVAALRELTTAAQVAPQEVDGISFSGQMHGLVLLDRHYRVLRRAILWNDTRTTAQCREIETVMGDRLLRITRNRALEGFTLPKILWVKEKEPEIFQQAHVFLLPKDYLRYRLTGQIHSEYSDAAGTLLLDVTGKQWSEEICQAFGIPLTLCPPLVESGDCVGTVLPEMANATGLSTQTRVFAGGADNACGAIGAGILQGGKALCSIGTSGVVLSYEEDGQRDYQGILHFFNHGKKDAFYSMGVTLAAGYSLSWLKNVWAKDEDFSSFVAEAERSDVGAHGLLFTPFLMGERTPYADAQIRGSFIGLDNSHTRGDFIRAVMEGITFSLKETVMRFREAGKQIGTIVSIGGGAKNPFWLQLQADIFEADVVKLENEQGPSMGAAMLAACGCGWFPSLNDCADHWLQTAVTVHPDAERAERYRQVFNIYQDVYAATRSLSARLEPFRK